MHLENLTYGIVGLGIMGGSFAKSIRENILSQNGAKGRILACNRSTACLHQAVSEGVVDEIFTSDRVSELVCRCDVLFICLYPHATLEFLKNNRELSLYNTFFNAIFLSLSYSLKPILAVP